MANTNKKAARKETDREPIWKGAVQGASDAVGCFPTRNEQRRNAPDSPPALRVGAQSGVCGVVALGNGTTIAGALRLASLRIGRQRDPPTD